AASILEHSSPRSCAAGSRVCAGIISLTLESRLAVEWGACQFLEGVFGPTQRSHRPGSCPPVNVPLTLESRQRRRVYAHEDRPGAERVQAQRDPGAPGA